MFRIALTAATATAILATGALAQSVRPAAEVIGIPRAITIAEGATKGRVLEAEMDYDRGRLVYEVKTTVGKGVTEVLIDAMSGDVVAERPLRIDSVWHGLRNADQLNAVRAGGPLSTTLSRLEGERRSRVTEVSLERERGQTFYEVEMADAGRHLLIDPRTGAVTEDRYDD